VGLVRGVYWAFTTEVWNPVDEAQHYAYVESLARGHGMPVVGEDKLSLNILEVAKASPTQPYQSNYYLPTEDFPWGAFGESYEGGGVQGPTYYAMLTPVYWLSNPFGETTSIFAVRIGSVAISLLAVPLLWLLAKRLFPDEPYIWLMAPGLLVLIQGFNSNVASVSNDALVIPVCIAAMIPVAAAFRGLETNQAVVGGALLGLALLTKMTTAPLAIYTGLVLLGLLVSGRESFATVVRWGLVYGAMALAVLAPYFAWNLHVYGSITASEQVNDITGTSLPDIPWSFDGLKVHIHNARASFWDFQMYNLGTHSAYVRVLQWGAVLALLAGLAVSIWKRDRERTVRLVWLGLAYPIAVVFIIAATYILFDGQGSGVGRHFYVSLGLVAIAISAGLVTAFGRRIGLVAFLVLTGLALMSEQRLTTNYIDKAYASGILEENIAPVIDQPVNEGYTVVDQINVEAPCPAQALGITYQSAPPPTLGVTSDATQARWDAPYLGRSGAVEIYTLPEPITGPITVIPGGNVSYSPNRNDSFITAPGVAGDPVMRLYCLVEDAKTQRFDQLYPPQHPDLSRATLRLWPAIWQWVGLMCLLTAVALLTYTGYTNLRSRSEKYGPDSPGIRHVDAG